MSGIPVPVNSPLDGTMHVCQFSEDWLPIVTGALNDLFNVAGWESPPSDIIPQVDTLLRLIEETVSIPDAIPIGSILLFAVDAAGRPDKWLLCHGQAISRSHYADLFALIGTHFGFGDNSTTFNVPDFRERFPLNCTSDGFDEIGLKGGVADLALSIDNLPAHHHQERGQNNVAAVQNTSAGTHASLQLVNSASTAPLTTADTGGDVPINLMNPYIKLQYCIYAGVSP